MVTLLSVVVVIWVGRNVRLPKRRLDYGISEVIPLLTPHSSIKDDLEVRHDGNLLTRPHLITIRIVLRGRQDIASDDYNDNQPFQIIIGSPIVAVLDITSRPDTSTVPHVVANDSSLAIGPSLIHCASPVSQTREGLSGQPGSATSGLWVTARTGPAAWRCSRRTALAAWLFRLLTAGSGGIVHQWCASVWAQLRVGRAMAE